MADGFIEMTAEKLTTAQGVAELNRMLAFLFDNVGGDGVTRKVYTGIGSPLNVVSAGVGSIYLRQDGGVGSSLWVKEANSDASGWVSK